MAGPTQLVTYTDILIRSNETRVIDLKTGYWDTATSWQIFKQPGYLALPDSWDFTSGILTIPNSWSGREALVFIRAASAGGATDGNTFNITVEGGAGKRKPQGLVIEFEGRIYIANTPEDVMAIQSMIAQIRELREQQRIREAAMLRARRQEEAEREANARFEREVERLARRKLQEEQRLKAKEDEIIREMAAALTPPRTKFARTSPAEAKMSASIGLRKFK